MTTNLLWRSFLTAFSGEFSNAAQAQAEPQWFVSTYLWQRPVPHLGPLLAPPLAPPLASETAQSLVFFLEQAPNLHRDRPYRQRLLQFGEDPTTGAWWGQYYQLLDYAQWVGAAQDPQRLEQLNPQACRPLPGCRLSLTLMDTQPNSANPANPADPANPANSERSFRAALPENQLCSFEYNQQTRYISVGFDLVMAPTGSVTLFSKDKGIDPETGQGLWGALMAPYRYEKVKTDEGFSG